MNDPTTDSGLIAVLMERLEKQRLPKLLALKEKVDSGQSPSDEDLDFLEKSIVDARKAIPLIDRHPEYQSMSAQIMALYKVISEKSLQMEKTSKGDF
jgi:hypothetical protein